MAIPLFPALVTLLGLLMWLFGTAHPKISEAGRILFASGVLVLLLLGAGAAVHVVRL